ncbi:hypothetical protein [Ancylobacter oerskovii]|uniref:Uncharacterized protein n=1 Tax=Ancylobacter oerskovii TaxID=459519 RepID=A0ABW4YZG3_9HYPH|nr:hypothetical protein [Ancylobacter oerskovii]MBS7541668.1 hypothetical protein [Ancylobacter oerskovii]
MRALRVPNPDAFGRVREWRPGVHIGIAPGAVTYLVIGTQVAVTIEEVEAIADARGGGLPPFGRGDFPGRWLDGLPLAEGLRPASPEDAEIVSLLVAEDFLSAKLPAILRELAAGIAAHGRETPAGTLPQGGSAAVA